MNLANAIRKSDGIYARIGLSEEYSHEIKVTKKDALEACKEYLHLALKDGTDVKNEAGAIIAMVNVDERSQDGSFDLHIGL